MLLKFGPPILRQRGLKITGTNYGLSCKSPPVTELIGNWYYVLQ
jgi:hypothetical protein